MDLSNKKAVVLDHGTFISVAERLARDFGTIYYVDPSWEQSGSKIDHAITGSGLAENVIRVPEIFDVVDECDVAIFPDVHHAAMQLFLEKHIQIPIWGARRADNLEIKKLAFKKLQERLGMNFADYDVIEGIDALREYCMNPDKTDRWVKCTPQFRGCFDDKTEILTEDGWKLFCDVTRHDHVLTLNTETGESSTVGVFKQIKYWHDGPMVHLKGRSIDALVTPDHHFWTKADGRTSSFKYGPVTELKGKRFLLPQSSEWKGDEMGLYSLPPVQMKQLGRKDRCKTELEMDGFLEFLGWFVSEGSISLAGQNKNKFRITISQCPKKNPEKTTLIRQCLKQFGVNIQTEPKGFSIYNKRLWLELQSICYDHAPCPCCGKKQSSHNKRVPKFIRWLSPRQIRIFLSSYQLGDGHCDRDGQRRFYTSSKGLADDIQELLIKTAKGTAISHRFRKSPRSNTICSCYTVSQRESASLNVLAENYGETEYHGWVYDVEVRPWHSIMVRRNGKSFWSGNSKETFHFDDYEDARKHVDEMSLYFEAVGHLIKFIAEKSIDCKIEGGLDTYTVDGAHPQTAVVGFEAKDMCYFAAVQKWKDIPEEIKCVSEFLWPEFKKYRCRQMFSTEVKVTEDGDSYLLEPTVRFPSPAGEEQMELYENFSEIIWEGAHGRLIEPILTAQFACEAMVEHSGNKDCFRSLVIPKEMRQWVKLYGPVGVKNRIACCPGSECIGAVVGIGNSPHECLEHLKANAAALDGQGLKIHITELADILDQIEHAEKEGLFFSHKELPDPADVLQ
jgi:hypothetical protein